jgi:CBS domain containing-hemolysin-like protein
MKSCKRVRLSGSASSAAALALTALALPSAAHASFLPPALMDTAATYLAWFILIVMPIGGVVLFWLVHILPEKIAHKRHHPQKDAIQTLCLLSLVFGGLLWPIAWLWAYTKPVSYRLAYGTDKADEYFEHMAEKAQAGELPPTEMKYLLDELDAIATRGAMSLELQHARTKIEAAIAAATAAAVPPPAPTATAPAAHGAA